MLIKKGEAIQISKIESADACIPSLDPNILNGFTKMAAGLKKIAPKAEDFLYFSAIMMHAAEASALNEDGSPRLTASGSPVEVGWEKKNGSMKWVSNDRNVFAYKNANGDIFPEEELVKAHKKWIGKPLCIDHKSDSVDHVRGFIVDTYYDRNLKRVIALCALDKQNYPDLARKVSTGYSNSVSMGTAVGQAICYDCGTAASREDQFCNHMRTKSCYGEINIDLNPIELSIVVNGADPKAHIKHIIAAANNLNSYVDSKRSQLNKLATNNFNAKISFTSDENDDEGISNDRKEIEINSNDLDQFQKDLEKAFEDLKALAETANNLESDKSGDDNSVDNGLSAPHERYASANLSADSIHELRSVTSSIQTKLNEMARSLNKLANTINKEENMSGSRINLNKKGYYQGTEEPTPGQVKYPAEPLNNSLRTNEDKQMLVDDMGPVDGMHPGPKSVGMSELERKKMLARAQSDERAMRREAIVDLAKQAVRNKSAYFQGGGDVNEPTPGKTKYPADKLNETLRDKEDKQMVGQKPFPDVGDITGLHPSPESVSEKDELKRKQMLSRANSLRGRFVVASNTDGSRDLSNSAWEIYRGDDLLLTASVNSLTGGNVDMLFDKVATKEFGTRLIDKIKVHGADRVRASLVKNAQDMAQAPMAAPAMPAAPAAPAAQPAFEMPAEEEAAPSSQEEQALELIEKAKDATSDAAEVLRELTNESAEMGGDDLMSLDGTEDQMAAAPMAVAASFKTASLQNMRKDLNRELRGALRESIATLRGYTKELEGINDMYKAGSVNKSNRAAVEALVKEACDETKVAIADASQLITAFVKYARGSEAIVKQAELECELNNKHKDFMDDDDLSDLMSQTESDLNDAEDLLSDLNNDDDFSGDAMDTGDLDNMEDLLNDTVFDDESTSLLGIDLDSDKDMVDVFDSEVSTKYNKDDDSDETSEDFSEEDDDEDESSLKSRWYEARDEARANGEQEFEFNGDVYDSDQEEYGVSEDENNAIWTDNAQDAAAAQAAAPNEDVFMGKKDASLNTKAGRAALRAKLAADAVKMSPMLDTAHPKGSHKLTQLSTQSGDLDVVEDLVGTHKKVLDLANAPVKVRKQAAEIHALIREGKMSEADFPALIVEGLDKDAVAFYKKYYGEVDGGSEFATELVKEHAKAMMQTELDTYKIKLARAYSLANEMVSRGLCLADNKSVSNQVDEIMQYNDESFDSLKRVVARHQPAMEKTAGRIPQVGIIGSEFSSEPQEGSLLEQLTSAFSGAGKRRF